MDKIFPQTLVVDDEQDITTNLAAFLERSAFLTRAAMDGQVDLEKIWQDLPDLVVLYVLMPCLDGRKVLRQMCKVRNWTPMILLTQVGKAFERAMALEEGADDYINKPFDPHELVACIRAVLRRARPGEPPLSAAWTLVSGALRLEKRSWRVYPHNQNFPVYVHFTGWVDHQNSEKCGDETL